MQDENSNPINPTGAQDLPSPVPTPQPTPPDDPIPSKIPAGVPVPTNGGRFEPGKLGVLPAQKPISPAVAKAALGKRVLPAFNLVVDRSPVVHQSAVVDGGNALAIPDLFEQARGLRNDLDTIYQFVHDNIEFSPNYGLHKGGLGALIDGYANSFDQVDLMIQLLQQPLTRDTGAPPAYPDCGYVIGTLRLNASQWSSWLGVDASSPAVAMQLLANGFIPVSQDPVTGELLVGHCWVYVTLSGTTYYFDPAFKSHSFTSKIVDLATAMGYIRTGTGGFLTGATSATGYSANADKVVNVSDSSISGNLTTYTSNLVQWIRNNAPGATFDDILGGQSIVPTTGTLRQTGHLPYEDLSSGTVSTFPLPDTYKATITIGVNYNSATNTADFWATGKAADIYGHRLTLFWNMTTRKATLYLDGTANGTSAAITANTWMNVYFGVTHPYGTTAADTYSISSILEGANTMIGNAWGISSKHMAQIHQQNQNQAIANGDTDSSEELLGSSLQIIFDNFVGEGSAGMDMLCRMADCAPVIHHWIGTVSQTPTASGKFKAISSFLSAFSISARDATTDVSSTSFAASLLVQGLEGTAAEQVTGVACADPLRLIRIANNAGTAIYDAKAANWTSGVNVRSKMSAAGYSSPTLDDIYNNYINPPACSTPPCPVWRVAMPENGNISFGVRTDLYGYMAIAPQPSGTGWLMQSWTLYNSKGAVSADYQDDGPTNSAASDNARQVDGFGMPAITASETTRVNLLNGRFEYSSTDLTIGNQGNPYELAFTRSYSSDLRLAFQGMGFGWCHNWQMSAAINSEGFIAFGDQQVSAAAPVIVALYVCRDIALSDATLPIQNVVITAITLQWLASQLTQNVVRLTTGGGTALFTRMPDGSYLPAMGMHGQSKLSFNSTTSVFSYTTPDQVVYTYGAGTTVSAAAGKISSIQYPFGITINFTYNSSGNLTKVTNGFRTLNFGYDSFGQLHTVNDGTTGSGTSGRTVTFTISSTGAQAGNLTAVQDPLTNSTTYNYDQRGRMTQVFKPANPTSPIFTNVFDSLSRVMQQTDAYGNIWQFFIAGTRSEEVAPNGTNRVSFFNERGSVIRSVNGLGQSVATTYDGNQRVTSVSLPEGNSSETYYDADGNVLQVVRHAKPGSGLVDRITSATYETTWNKMASSTDAAGNVSLFEYYASGNGAGLIKTVTAPALAAGTPYTQFTYTVIGQLDTMTDPSGLVRKHVYDPTSHDLTLIKLDPSGLNLVTSLTYDSVGNAITVTDPNGNLTSVQFDALRRETQITTPSSKVATVVYDANGNVTQSQSLLSGDPNSQMWTNTYTIDDKVLTTVGPANFGDVTPPVPVQFRYDNMRRLATVTDAQGHITSTIFDELSRPITGSVDGMTQQSVTYAANGGVQTFTDARGKTTTHTYDGFDRAIKTTYPDLSFESVVYDSRNNVVQAFTRAGLRFDFSYDAASKLVSRTPFEQPTISMTYDLAGRLLTTSTPTVAGDPTTGTFSVLYDTAKRAIGEQYPDAKTVSVTLDNAGNPTALKYPDGNQVAQVLDALDRVTSISGFGGNVSFGYDSTSRRTSQFNGNGTIQSYAFDKVDALIATTIRNLTPNSLLPSSRVDLAFDSDNLDSTRSVRVSDSGLLWLPTLTRTNTYAAANSVNQYPSVDGVALTYDADGNLTNDGASTFEYDFEGKLTRVTTGSTVVTYKYDPLGRLSQKTVGAQSVRYLYSGMQRIEDYNGAGTLIRRYIYGVGADECLFSVDAASGLVSYLHKDELGSTILVTDGTGSVSLKNVYSPWGELSVGSLTTIPIGFKGQFFDSDTGLYYLKSRHYSPKLGRFLQPDPAGYEGGSNLYAYCGNDPINFTDAVGLDFLQGSVSTDQGTQGPGLLSRLGSGLGTAAGYLYALALFGGPTVGGVLDSNFANVTAYNSSPAAAGIASGGSGAGGQRIPSGEEIAEQAARDQWTAVAAGYGIAQANAAIARAERIAAIKAEVARYQRQSVPDPLQTIRAFSSGFGQDRYNSWDTVDQTDPWNKAARAYGSLVFLALSFRAGSKSGLPKRTGDLQEFSHGWPTTSWFKKMGIPKKVHHGNPLFGNYVHANVHALSDWDRYHRFGGFMDEAWRLAHPFWPLPVRIIVRTPTVYWGGAIGGTYLWWNNH